MRIIISSLIIVALYMWYHRMNSSPQENDIAPETVSQAEPQLSDGDIDISAITQETVLNFILGITDWRFKQQICRAPSGLSIDYHIAHRIGYSVSVYEIFQHRQFITRDIRLRVKDQPEIIFMTGYHDGIEYAVGPLEETSIAAYHRELQGPIQWFDGADDVQTILSVCHDELDSALNQLVLIE